MPCGPRQTAQAYLMKRANSSGGVVFFDHVAKVSAQCKGKYVAVVDGEFFVADSRKEAHDLARAHYPTGQPFVICIPLKTRKMVYARYWNDGHLLVVRDVPVRECQASGHRFFPARVARALERLFELDRQRKLEPIETMEVPVVRLELVA